MKEIEIGNNLSATIITVIICSFLAFLSYQVKDYNKSVFEQGYTQIVQEGRIVWVKADSITP